MVPPGGAGVGPGLCSTVSHRWVPGVSDGLADPLWAVGAATTAPGYRPRTEAAVAATAAAALRAGGQDGATPTPGRRAAPRGVWLPGGRQARAGPPGVADQYRLCGAAQPQHPPAWRRRPAAGQQGLEGRRRVA